MTNQLTVVDQNGEVVNITDEGLAMPLPQLVERMRLYQEVCKALLVDSDYQKIGDRLFKKKSAYRKLALAFGVSTQIIEKDIVYVDGRIHHAEFTVRATAKNGRYIESWGQASTEDRDFSHDQDVAATAETRATSRAIANVLGTGEVSAEEMTDKPNRSRTTKRELVDASIAANAERAHAEDAPEDLGKCPMGHRYREGKYGIQCTGKLEDGTWHNHKKVIDTSRYSTAPVGKSQPQSTAPQPAPEGRQRIDGMIVGVGGTATEPTVTVEKQGKRLMFRLSPNLPADLVANADNIEWSIDALVQPAGDGGYVIVEVTSLTPPMVDA